MEVVKQSCEIVSPFDREIALSVLEMAGRTCYKSQCGDSGKFIKKITKSGHHSVVEHYVVSVRIITNRAISHQLVRHRVASFSQESQRYCNYSKDKFDNQLTFIDPIDLNENQYNCWNESMTQAEQNYFKMIEEGCKPQQAREVLPNACKTEMVMTANLREWAHVFELRTKNGADPMVMDLIRPLQKQFQEILPEVFGVEEEKEK